MKTDERKMTQQEVHVFLFCGKQRNEINELTPF
jgi:hypothetical protein